jgi:hypothetical protein
MKPHYRWTPNGPLQVGISCKDGSLFEKWYFIGEFFASSRISNDDLRW